MRTTGRRTLAGIAAGALAFAGLAFVATPSAQAAQTVAVYCSTNNPTGGGTLPDPTTIQPNCVLPAGLGEIAGFAGTFLFDPTSMAVLTLSVSGDSTFNDNVGTLSTDKKTISVPQGSLSGVQLNVATPGVRTVAITGGPDALVQNQRDLGTLTVTGTGAAGSIVTSQGYYAVEDTSTAANVPVALVHILDANGVPLDLTTATVTNVVSNAASGSIGATLYRANDCDADSLLTAANVVTDPGGTATNLIVTDACDTAVGAKVSAVNNSGYWVTWTGTGSARGGSYTATLTITVGANTYPVTVNYVVSNYLGAAFTVEFDKAEYLKGSKVTADVCAKDLNGRILPDGSGWGSGRTVGALTNAPIYSTTDGLVVTPTNLFTPPTQVGTYNGCATVEFIAPPTDMAGFAFSVTASSSAGWTAAVTGTTQTATARIGDPAPVTKSIAIVGSRVEGTNQVIVEGTSEGLAGKTVTPYFRFPGETGFTAGTGTRTVDAEGNFNWQRKTGKKIAVQFRGDGVVSNTVIIDAK